MNNSLTALKLLKEYSGIEIKKVNSPEEKQALAQALLSIVKLADDQNIGICADNSQEALQTLSSYLSAFNYDEPINFQMELEENIPVYLKFSTQRKAYNMESYMGDYRGALITIFSIEHENMEGTYGYFPLDLFRD